MSLVKLREILIQYPRRDRIVFELFAQIIDELFSVDRGATFSQGVECFL